MITSRKFCLFFCIIGFQAVLGQSKWYKGQVHTHTTQSDGELTSQQMTQKYHDLGYSFVVITDHNKVTPVDHLSASDFLVFTGEEVSTDAHWGAIDLKTTIDPGQLTGQQCIDRINGQSAIPVLNHPRWSWINFSKQDVLALQNIDHMEIYNTITCNIWSYLDYTELWDEVLSSGRKIYGVATDDFHNVQEENHWYLNVGWIMVAAPSLTRENILYALRNGDFYSSTGPVFTELKNDNGLVTVDVDKSCTIKFIGKNGQVFKEVKGTSAIYQATGVEGYVRVDAVNSANKHAWSQPLIFYGSGDMLRRLVYGAGDKQSGLVNESLSAPLSVKLVNSSAKAVADERVLFKVLAGGGKLNGRDTLSVLTDVNGLAQINVQLGTLAGDSNQVFTASVKNGVNEITFKATALAGTAAKLTLISGNNQSAPNNQTLGAPLVVQVADGFNNLKINQEVHFTVTAGAGLINGQATAAVISTAQGLASATWKLGNIGKEQQVKAAVPNAAIPEIVFNATASSKPALLSLVSGNGQTTVVNKVLPNPLIVAVTDTFGAAISGQAVLFEVSGGGGKVNDKSSWSGVTDASGRVSVAWTLGATAGSQTVKVSATLNSKQLATRPDPLVFTATALAEAAAKIVVKEGTNQTAMANHLLPLKVKVQACDVYNNAVSGAQVYCRIKTGNGAIAESQPLLTDAGGMAAVTWTLGPLLGNQQMEIWPGTVQNGVMVVTATATKSIPKAISIVSGNSQKVIANDIAKDSLKVVLKDENNGAVQGFPVNFSIQAGTGSLLCPNPDSTDSRGYAVMRYRPTNVTGVHRVRATSVDLGKYVEFDFTVQADDAAQLNVLLTEMNQPSYQLDIAAVGSLAYVDRSYTITELPDTLRSIYLLKTANTDKNSALDSFLTFNLSQPTLFYVAYDQRVTTPPDWLKKNFTQTGDYVLLSDKTRLSLWRQDAVAGKMTLGANKAAGFSTSGAYSMYLVLYRFRTVVDRVPPAAPQGLAVTEER